MVGTESLLHKDNLNSEVITMSPIRRNRSLGTKGGEVFILDSQISIQQNSLISQVVTECEIVWLFSFAICFYIVHCPIMPKCKLTVYHPHCGDCQKVRTRLVSLPFPKAGGGSGDWVWLQMTGANLQLNCAVTLQS